MPRQFYWPKMRKLLCNYFVTKNRGFLFTHTAKRSTTSTHQYNFDTDEEITENYFGNVMLIGINLPCSKNTLTETALGKLCNSIKNFQNNDELVSAVLHGSGGNFCTGVLETEKALNKSQELLEILYKGKKPILGALNGYTTNFGFQLALMCDFRVMEESALASFGSQSHRSKIPTFVYRKLVLTVGHAKAMQMVLTKCTWTANYSLEAGFSIKTSECGTSLGQCIIWAQSIGHSHLLEWIVKEKSKIDLLLNED